MGVKVRLRALRVRALEAGPSRLVLTLGEGAALDAFELAKRVQSSGGALRLTPDMKLVAYLGANGQLAAPAAARPPAVPARGGAARAARAEKVQAAMARAVAQARPSPTASHSPSPAQEAAQGKLILAAVVRLLDDLSRIAA